MLTTSILFCAVFVSMTRFCTSHRYMTDRSNCTLSQKEQKDASRIGTIVDKNRLIRFELDIDGELGMLSEKFPSGLLNPTELILLTDESAQILLLLPDNHVQMSFYALSFHVERFHMSLNQVPHNCLNNSNSVEEIVSIIRHFIWNFTLENSGVNENFEICNRFVKLADSNKTGEPQYVCCDMETGSCTPLEPGVWLQRFYNFLNSVQILVLLFCPLFIPKSLYRSFNSNFKCHVEGLRFMKVKVIKIRNPDVECTQELMTSMQFCNFFNNFKRIVKEMNCDEHIFQIKDINILVDQSDVILEGSHPFGLPQFLYNNFIRCQIREHSSPLNECFQTNMCKVCNEKKGDESRQCVFSWFSCTNVIMTLLIFTVITLPWWILIIFYSVVNKPYIEYIESVETLMSISIEFNLRPTITTSQYVSFVSIFIFFCIYQRFPIHKLFLKVVLDITINGNETFVKSLSDWLKVVFYPMKEHGLLGCFYYPFWLVLVVLNFLFFLIKTVPLTALLYRLSSSVQNCGIKAVIFLQVFLLGLIVFSIVGACIIFYCDCIVYIVVGLLLNYDDVFPYISFLLLISIYGYNCFHRVDDVFLNFINTLNKETQHRITWLNENANIPNQQLGNIAYTLQESSDTPQADTECFKVLRDGQFLWKASRLCSFLYNSDSKPQYCLSNKFLETVNKIPHGNSPGSPFVLYLKSLRDFALVSVFLYFVVIVVFALGKAHDLPSGIQTMVALGGGFLPFILQKVFFRLGSQQVSDLTNKIWEKMLDSEIDSFNELWNVIDMDLSSTPLNSERELSDCENSLRNIQTEVENIFKIYAHIEGKNVRLFVPKACETNEVSVNVQNNDNYNVPTDNNGERQRLVER